MPRPKSKQELLEVSQQNFQRLNELVDSFTKADQLKEFPKGTMNRNMRDVLAHLHHWHLMFLGWYETGMVGRKPDMPAKGHTWATTPELNKEIWKQYNDVDLSVVRKQLKASFARLQSLIKHHTNEELFEKRRYGWTGTTSLGSYLVSATSSHYDWAYKLIKKATR